MNDTVTHPNKTITVAIIDNDVADRELIRRLISEMDQWDSRFILINSVQEARDLLARRRDVDLILLDYVLGMDSGLDVLKEAHAAAVECPIIFMTGHGDQDVAAAAMRLGACDYLVKQNMSPANLRESMARAFASHQSIIRQRQMQRMACIDELTGVWRRWYFIEQCRLEIERSFRYAHNLAFAMFDIDRFKAVNDTWGHPVGDKVLQHVSALLKQHLRQTDLLGRYGGEEFCLLFPQTDITDGVRLVERLRETIGHSHVALNENTNIRVTVSVGVTELKKDDHDVHDLITRADQALYRAKRDGRNMVVCF